MDALFIDHVGWIDLGIPISGLNQPDSPKTHETPPRVAA